MNSVDNENKTDLIDDDNINRLKTAQLADFTGYGTEVDITLQESIIDTTTKNFLNISDSNSFTEASPMIVGFNTSYTNIAVNNIVAPNKTLIVEEDYSGQVLLSSVHYTSFQVLKSCWLEDVSVEIYTSGAINETFNFDVYGAMWDGSYIKYDISKDLTGAGSDLGQLVNDSTSRFWYNLTNLHQYLNVDNTYQNTFFIRVSASNSQGFWTYESQSNHGSADDTISWNVALGTPLSNTDLTLKVNVSLNDNTPSPSDINLQIEDIPVNDLGLSNSGYFETTQGLLEDLSGNLQFDITADWWDVSCDITAVQINYTKSDINIDSSYLIPNGASPVQWIVDAGAINYFDSRIDHTNTINFTVPSYWQDGNINVFNDTEEKTSLVFQDLGSGLKNVMVLDGGNGTNWYLTATTPNLLDDLITSVGGTPYSTMNYTNVIDFTANFIETVYDGTINLTVYSPSPHYINHTQTFNILSPESSFDLSSSWDISTSLETYGEFLLQLTWINGTAAGFFENNITIMAETELELTSQNNIEIFNNQVFNVNVFYNNTGEDEGILNANMFDHSGLSTDSGSLGGGDYYVEFNSADFNYGYNNIEIEAWKDYYYNDSIIFSFNKIANTSITPDLEPSIGPIIRGQDATYRLDYRYGDSDLPITDATIIPDGLGMATGLSDLGTINHGNGSYTIRIDTGDADVSSSPFVCYFKASSEGNESQYINITVNIVMASVQLENIIYDNIVTEASGYNQTVTFYFHDIIKDEPITGATTTDIDVLNTTDGSSWDRSDFNWALYEQGGGYYELNISTNNLDVGWYYITINMSYSPNYNWTSYDFSFYFSGNETQINLVSVSHLIAGILTPNENNYTFYAGNDLQITLNISALNNLNLLLEGFSFDFTVNYTSYTTPLEGTITNAISQAGSLYQGPISTSSLSAGDYKITLFANHTDYEVESYSFNLTIVAKYQLRISTIDPPTEVTAGESFNLKLFVEYNNGITWLPLPSQQVSISVLFYLKGGATNSPPILDNNTNSNGIVWFTITLTTSVTNMTIQVNIIEEYDHELEVLDVPTITVKAANLGIQMKDIIMWIVILSILALVAVMGIVGYRKIVIPQKRRKEGVLDEVKTVFDDAVNIEHILVLYKGSGTCVFFKSYGSEKIDPDLISGFISAVSSFGKEVESQKALNEISYEDKMLLLADGSYIRVALVLSKKASIFLRGKLREFIKSFESRYSSALPKWRGQLNVFKDAGPLIDDVFKTSIILPHQIQYNQKAIKNLKVLTSKDVLSNAKALVEESGREFVFISKLLDKTLTKSNKGIAKVFMGIKELRDAQILVPLDISGLDKKVISPQERQMIEQRICQFVALPREEQQQMIEQLSQMSSEEREVYMASLQEKQEIVSAPIKSKIGGKVIENEKDASKQIKSLINKAKKEKKVFSYKKAVIYYEEAAILATNWDLKRITGELQEAIRLTQIDELVLTKKEFEDQAQKAARQKNYQEAARKFKQAADVSSQIFKLGVNEMQDEVKRLTIASKKVEKL